jgi:gp16 family phage-associated protein
LETTRSVQEAKAWFVSHGLTVRSWAKANGFAAEQVYSVLSGRARGRHGAAHAIAIALGIKACPSADAWMQDNNALGDSVRRNAVAQRGRK